MTDFRKIIVGLLASLMLFAPCYAFAGELSEGEFVSETFDNAEDGTDYYDLTEYIEANSEMFSTYHAHTTPSLWINLPGVGMKEYISVTSAALEEAARAKVVASATGEVAINDDRTNAVIDGRFHLGKTPTALTHSWYNVFTLKNPITSGVYRISFEVERPSGITGFANPFMFFYDFEPVERFYGNTSTYGSAPVQVSFNETMLYFATDYNPATEKSEVWNGVTSAGFGPGTYDVDIIIDADNKLFNFFLNGTFVRAAVYKGEGIRSLSIFNANHRYWKGSGDGEVALVFDNFVQERLVPPAYTFNIEDGVYDVPADTAPTYTFEEAVDKSVADSIIIYKDGNVLEGIERILSEDGKEITFDMQLDYSAGYRFELPEGNRAVNKAPIMSSGAGFRTEHRPTSVVVENETKPDYAANENYTATITLTNTSDLPVQAAYVVAFYDSLGRMFDIDYAAATLDANAEGTPLSVELSASDKEDVTVKTFLIDALHTMNPLVTDID